MFRETSPAGAPTPEVFQNGLHRRLPLWSATLNLAIAEEILRALHRPVKPAVARTFRKSSVY